jgi:murein tripeptide amidase MpaA
MDCLQGELLEALKTLSFLLTFSQVIEYLTSQLILNYGKDDQVTGFVDDFDFWIFPFVNPDGKLSLQQDSDMNTR